MIKKLLDIHALLSSVFQIKNLIKLSRTTFLAISLFMFYSQKAGPHPPKTIRRKIGVDMRTGPRRKHQVQTSLEFLNLDHVNQSRNNVYPIQIANIKESPEVDFIESSKFYIHQAYTIIFQNLADGIKKKEVIWEGTKIFLEDILVGDMKALWDLTGGGWSDSKSCCHYCGCMKKDSGILFSVSRSKK